MMLASWIPKVAKGWKLSTNCQKKLRPSYDIWYNNCHITQQFCFKCRKSDGKPTWTKWLAVLWSQLVATKDPINIYPSTSRGNLEQWSQPSQVPIWFAYLTILPGSAAGAAALIYQIGTVPDFETDSRVDDFPVDEKGFRIGWIAHGYTPVLVGNPGSSWRPGSGNTHP